MEDGPEPIQATFKSGLVTAQASLSDTPTQGIMHGIVGDKAFQTANSHRLALDAQDALAFTLVFLRAHGRTRRKAVGALQDTVGFRYVTLDDLSDEFGNTDFNRTPLTAARGFLHWRQRLASSCACSNE